MHTDLRHTSHGRPAASLFAKL